MNPRGAELRARVKRLEIRVVRFVRSLPSDMPTREVGYQLLKAGTGESANYHAACRGRSRAEFIAKLGTTVEEADEAEHWLDVIKGAELTTDSELTWLIGEAAELRAIFKQSLETARANNERDKLEGTNRRQDGNPPIRKSSSMPNCRNPPDG